MQISSKTPHPFVSLDIHTRNNIYTTLAVIDRSGLLTIFVPETPDRLIEWRVLAQWAVLTPPPTPGEETSFKVRWDPNPQGLPYVNSLTDVKDTLRLVVSAMDTIKIYHALPADSTNPALQFHLEASLAPYPGVLVRDVAWAPFNVRGTDLLATAGRNGAVSIIEMGYKARVGDGDGKAGGKFVRQAAISSPMSTATPISRPPPQSHLSSALASRPHPGTPSNTSPSLPSTSQAPNPLPYSTTLRIVTTNPSAHDDAWSLAWDPAGQVLMSNGSEGRTVMWKKSILEGEWREFSSVEFEVEEEEEEGEEEREGWVV
jgi:nucleoporin SEH1